MYIDFPDISPVIFSIGPFSFRWYAMAYLAGIVAAWLLTKRNIAKYNLGITNEQLDDLVFYTTLGIILGGRIGYVVCYGDGYFWKHPSEIIAVWHGGMSFHGGIAGVILGLLCAKIRVPVPEDYGYCRFICSYRNLFGQACQLCQWRVMGAGYNRSLGG